METIFLDATHIILLASESLGSEICLQIIKLLSDCVWLIRGQPQFKNAPIVMIVEGQDVQANIMEHFLHEHENVCFMREVSDGRRFGVPKDANMTTCMRMALSWALSMGLFRVWEGAVAASTEYAAQKIAFRALRRKLCEQLLAYRNKPDSKKSAGKNDMAITLMMIAFWVPYFLRSTRCEYAPCKRQIEAIVASAKRARLT